MELKVLPIQESNPDLRRLDVVPSDSEGLFIINPQFNLRVVGAMGLRGVTDAIINAVEEGELTAKNFFEEAPNHTPFNRLFRLNYDLVGTLILNMEEHLQLVTTDSNAPIQDFQEVIPWR